MTRHAKTIQLIETAAEILAEHNPMTVRQVYYQLVSRQVVKNSRSSYQSVSKALVAARRDAIISWQWIEDRLRKPRHVSMWPGLAEFCEGGLVVFTRDMAIELASSGVRINCVCPGVIDTGMMERWTKLMPDQEQAKEMLRGVMPIGRMGRADEVAGAIFFFASDDSSLCQGAVLSVDGGFTAQ